MNPNFNSDSNHPRSRKIGSFTPNPVFFFLEMSFFKFGEASARQAITALTANQRQAEIEDALKHIKQAQSRYQEQYASLLRDANRVRLTFNPEDRIASLQRIQEQINRLFEACTSDPRSASNAFG